MKAPKARKLPSGQWFCRVRVNGQDISITRPTEKEAVADAMAVKAGLKDVTPGRDKTLTAAIDEYIASRDGIVSPSTIRGYRAIQKYYFQPVMHTRLSAISDAKWQAMVNLEAKQHKPKTVKNAWGFLSSVVKYATGRTVTLRLPQQIPAEKEILDDEQIDTFLQAIRGQKVEIPALLALSSLRASEIRGLMWDDVDLEAGVLHINGATVMDEHGKLVHKPQTKNSSSRRTVVIIKQLQQALEAVPEKTGPVVTVRQIYPMINRACEKAGLPKVGVHGLRHSFASLCAYLGIPEEETMAQGGWKRRETMHYIYEHAYEKTRENYGKAFSSYFASKNGNENGNK